MAWSNPSPKDTSSSSLKFVGISFTFLLVCGIVIVEMYGPDTPMKATIYLWMIACLLCGAAIGFLFGIPKILQNNTIPKEIETDKPVYQQQVNTNLTEISDWLTKIIVGLGLVNLNKLPPYLANLAGILAKGVSIPSTKPSELAYAFAYGTITSYSILGFLFGYLATRLYLATAFSVADQRALSQIAKQTAEAAGAAQSALHKAEFVLAGTPTSPGEEANAYQESWEELAQKYNHLRDTLPSGHARTRKMTEIIKELMALLPNQEGFDPGKALQEPNNGRRLAAYAYLYVKPSQHFLEALADAITNDPTPFGQYWGILALGKILETQTDGKVLPYLYRKLKSYYDQLGDGVDRKYELGKILPQLANSPYYVLSKGT